MGGGWPLYNVHDRHTTEPSSTPECVWVSLGKKSTFFKFRERLQFCLKANCV